MWVDKYRTEEALIESEMSLDPTLLGKMGVFDGLSKAEYNKLPMFITKIDYERRRLIVETGVDANHLLPTFASLPYDKLTGTWYDDGENISWYEKNRLCLGASRATNLRAALVAGDLDVANITCVQYHEHSSVPLHGYSEQRHLADAIGGTVVFGYYVYGKARSAHKSSAFFSDEKNPMIKDKHGNYIDVLPDIGIEHGIKPMSMRLFIEDPWVTHLSLNCICSGVLPNFIDGKVGAIQVKCFPFSSKAIFAPTVKQDHTMMVESRILEVRTELGQDTLLMDRRTFVAFAKTAISRHLNDSKCLTHFSLDIWPIVLATQQCSCCGICTHLDIVTCSDCQTAHYCSKLCLKHHCRAHKKDCKRPDWMERAKAAEKMQKARLARYEANAKAEAQVEKDKEMARKRMAENERKLKAAAGDKPYTLPGESHRQTPKDAKPPKSMEEEMAQMQFKEEKPLRAAAFAEKQQREHQEAVARKAKVKADAEKAAAAEASKEYEASVHLVPPPAKMELPF